MACDWLLTTKWPHAIVRVTSPLQTIIQALLNVCLELHTTCIYMYIMSLVGPQHGVSVREFHLQVPVDDSEAVAVAHTVQDLLDAVAEWT